MQHFAKQGIFSTFSPYDIQLIRWKIVTHGGIDGKTRVVVYLRASNNNRAETVAKAFKSATEVYGWPSRIRADWGGENMQVKAMIEEARGAGRGSFFAGASTHNQRIESTKVSNDCASFLTFLLGILSIGLWRDVFSWTIQPFYTLFSLMEDHGLLNIEDPLQLWSLHFVFLPRINRALQEFINTWNNHKLSTEQNRSPLELWNRGERSSDRF